MARQAPPTIGRPTPIQPVATPVSTYVRPADPAPSNLHQLAQGMAVLDSGLKVWLQKRKAEQAKADAIRGEAAFYRDNAPGLAAGVANGDIPAHQSPIFMQSWKKAQGNQMGIEMRSQFAQEYAQWEGRNSEDPEAFPTFLDDFVTRHITTDDADVLAGLLPHVEALTDSAQTTYSTDRANTVYNGSINTRAAIVGDIIDYASQQGIALEAGTNYEEMKADILDQRKEALSVGIRMADFDRQLVETIAAKAIEHGDPNLLGILEDTLPGYEVKLSSLPDFRDVKATTIAALTLEARRQGEAEAKRQAAYDKAREGQIVSSVYKALSESPGAEVPEEVLTEWEKYDPEARKKLVDARKSLTDGLTLEDPDDLITIERMIQSGSGKDDIFELAANGVIKDPATFKALLDRIEQREQVAASILTTQTTKRYLTTIKERTTLVGPDAMFAPDGLTDEGIEATSYFEQMLIEWRLANPEATLFEQDQFVKQAADLVLGRIAPDELGGPPQFMSVEDEERIQAEEARLRAEEEARLKGLVEGFGDLNSSNNGQPQLPPPSAIEEGFHIGTFGLVGRRAQPETPASAPPEEDITALYGQEAPPTPSTLTPSAQRTTQSQAELLGMTHEEYLLETWRMVREGLGLSTETPEEILQSFDPASAQGLIEQGNINLDTRKVLQNDDGSISTERSMSFNEDGVEVLVPTVVDGRLLSDEEAVEHYHQTGEHLGKFSTPEDAEAFAERLHLRQEVFYKNRPAPDLSGFVDPKSNPEVNQSVLLKFAGRRLPVSIRNNNMGAVSIVGDIQGSWAARQPGFVGVTPRPANEGGYYAKYATPEHGVAAASRLLERYGQQGVNTPLAIVTKWSADTTAHNSYASTLVSYLTQAGFNVDKNTVLDLSNPIVRLAILKAKSHHEAGAGAPVYADAVFQRGVNYQLT